MEYKINKLLSIVSFFVASVMLLFSFFLVHQLAGVSRNIEKQIQQLENDHRAIRRGQDLFNYQLEKMEEDLNQLNREINGDK